MGGQNMDKNYVATYQVNEHSKYDGRVIHSEYVSENTIGENISEVRDNTSRPHNGPNLNSNQSATLVSVVEKRGK